MMLLVKKLDSPWFVGAVCIGIAHGSKYMWGFMFQGQEFGKMHN